jgi:hypothetical protein
MKTVSLLKTFIVPAIQVGLINLTIVMVSHHQLWIAWACSAGISLCWIFNITNIVKCDALHKVIYVLGAYFVTACALFGWG